MTPNGWLHVLSCLYLALIVTLILGIIEFDDWRSVLRSTARRWLKLIGALVAIGIVVQTCTFITEKKAPASEKSLDEMPGRVLTSNTDTGGIVPSGSKR